MNDRIQKDIKLLLLTELVSKANALVKELDIECVYLSKYCSNIELSPEAGQESMLCFIPGEHSYDSDRAICKAGDLDIYFKIPPKPIAESTTLSHSETSSAAA